MHSPFFWLIFISLFGQNSLEQWATWLEGVVDQVLKQHEDTEMFPKAARQFLLKWSFYRYAVSCDLHVKNLMDQF